MNELIEMVATSKPLPPDPADDLMFREPPRNPTPPPRVSGTIPPVRGAGEVSPLPLGRLPSGTSAHGVPVRMSTAPQQHAALGFPTLMGTGAPPVVAPGVIPPPPNQAQTLMGLGIRDEFITTTRMPPPEHMEQPAPPVLPPDNMPPGAFTTQPSNMPVAAPFEASPSYPSGQALPKHADMTAHAPWYEDSDKLGRVDSNAEQFTGTQQIKRQGDWQQLAGKLIAPMIGLVVLGIFVGGYFAFDGEGGKPRQPKAAVQPAQPPQSAITVIPQPAPAPAPAPETTPAPVAAAAPAPAPEPAPAPAPAPTPAPADPAPAPATAALATGAVPMTPPSAPAAPELVDIRIDSKPAGATVMLVDRGKTNFLGTTPISSSLDPSRQYDLVFMSAGLPTRLEHLDPKLTKHVSVSLTHSSRKSTAPEAPKSSAASADGTLMISTKPPCEIFIDDKPTGLITPQRAITLPVGTHKVTLVNAAEKLKKTIAVEITADQPTKVIQDLMN